MLAATDIGAFVWVVVVSLMMVTSLLAKRGAKKFRDSLEVRDRRVVLKEDVRLKLGKSPRRLHKAEALIARSYAVNERGEIVDRSGSAVPANVPWYRREISFGRNEPKQPSAPALPQAPESEKSREGERFRSAWDEQDAAPSIWDENDATAFWGDAEKFK